MPQISIIVPVYNVEKYLNRCVDSILNQTFKDFELILVNDGSKDKSGNICDEYEKKDSRVKVIHKPNGGVSSARNTGIDNATGKYIMFVDSDDYIDSNMLSNMLKTINNDIDLIVSSIKMVTKNGNSEFKMPNKLYTTKEILEEYCCELFPRICLCGPVCKIYKLEIINRYNLRFRTDLSLGEDTYFNMGYLKYSCCIVTVSEIYYFYMRDNESSLFSKFQNSTYEQNREVFLFTENVLNEVNCNKSAAVRLYYTYANDLVGVLVKAFLTNTKNVFIDYLQKISNDKILTEQYHILDKKKKIIAFLIINKQYWLVYQIYKLWSIKYKIKMIHMTDS